MKIVCKSFFDILLACQERARKNRRNYSDIDVIRFAGEKLKLSEPRINVVD